jgi:hypothetical protein
MNLNEFARKTLDLADFCVKLYLNDLSDADLLVRPAAGANHIAWQLGHLITSEHELMDVLSPGSMPALPEGFKERHSKQTASLDDPAAFLSKAEYLAIYEQQRAGTLAIVEKVQESDLDRPSPEFCQNYAPTHGDILALEGEHWMMHAGQWVIVRRKLGMPAVF